MDGSLSNKPENFVDDPEKIYRQRRREARSRKPELVDPKVEADDSSSSPQATPPTSPKEASLYQGMALPELERTIVFTISHKGISMLVDCFLSLWFR